MTLQISYVEGLPQRETEILNELVHVLDEKEANNRERVIYYKSQNTLKDLGISIPDCLRNMRNSVGWASKAVDALAVRSRFDGFSFADGEPHGLDTIFTTNSFKSKYQQSVTSELINSCAFLTISKGGEGEPDVIVNAYSALNASAVWDFRRNRIKYGLVVADRVKDTISRDYKPSVINLYTDTDIFELVKQDNAWVAYPHPHEMGRPLMEALVYRPTIDRPFGRSRISKDVMEIIDCATRESVRTEIHSEFFTSPQRVILGVDPDDVFSNKSQSQAYMGSYLAMGLNEEGEVPQVSQFPQASMQPHLDYMRSLASRFSALTNVPISEMGVISDNPSSAEAIYAAKEALVIEAEDLNASNGEALKNIGKMALAILQNKPLSALTTEELSIMPRFKNPAMPSIVSQSDAMVKQASCATSENWFARTQIFWEELGYSEEQVARIMSFIKNEGIRTKMNEIERNSRSNANG